jgi:hypothetical protein
MPQELIGPATRAPSTHDILDVWRADGRVHEAASVVYPSTSNTSGGFVSIVRSTLSKNETS